MQVFGLTIFLSAFLLFQIQPMIAKAILPWYGSSPAVWTTCMLFFQTLLLAGYAYAHLSATFLPRRVQAVLHATLLCLAATSLPIAPSQPTSLDSGDPTWQILNVLVRSVGLPYFLLSASGPLFQAWFSLKYPGRAQYRLYALSNIGSLAALLTYPLLVEPLLTVGHQGIVWSMGFLGLVATAGGCAWLVFHSAPAPISPPASTAQPSGPASAAPTWGTILAWGGFATTGSALLLAITNQMCQDIAVVPFLWVLPLSVYLVSFILCFESDRWYRRIPYLVGTAIGSCLISLAMLDLLSMNLWAQVGLYVGVAFAGCMCCHGELARLRPAPAWSTLFYLVVSIGGAIGGFCVALVAPRIFLRYWELDLSLAATCLLTWMAMVREASPQAGTAARAGKTREPVVVPGKRKQNRKSSASLSSAQLSAAPSQWSVGLVGILVLAVDACLGLHIYSEHENIMRVERNFYGVISVRMNGARKVRTQDGQEATEVRADYLSVSLHHGGIIHGLQYQAPDKRDKPNLYYSERSGVGLAINEHPQRNTADRPFRIGVIGLGTGTLAAYAKDHDYIRFYEINPAVVRIAEEAQTDDGARYFTYTHDAQQRGASVVTSLGDARIVLTRDIQTGHAEQFDVLVVDAFSGDAIPLHLLTRESLEIYFQNLAPDGVIAFHISNLYLDLAPVVNRLAEEKHARAILVGTDPDELNGIEGSRWVLITKNEAFYTKSLAWPELLAWKPHDLHGPLWTDQFSSIVPVVIWWLP